MANELCASGFGTAVDGNYQLMYRDHWTNGTYWIYKDSWYWMISNSEFYYGEGYIVARKAYVAGSWANGSYTGVDGNPSGNVALGICP
jgi:hypothetical protein